MCSNQVLIANPRRNVPGEPHHTTVPCGGCKECLNKRSNHWFLRLMYESKTQPHADFITLTFSQAPRTPNGYLTAPKKILQDYFKRLRKRTNSNGIKYYACSEYGEQNHRPHYHAIVFGVQDKRHYLHAWNQEGQGIIDVDTIHPGQIRYVTGYIEKRIGIPWTPDDDRQPEFSLMSKNLGLHFLSETALWNDKYQDSETTYAGVTYSLPRYYKDRIWPDAYTITYKPHPLRVYKRGSKKGQPLMMQSKKILYHHPTKKLINEKNTLRHAQNENRLIKNFPTIQAFRKNQQEISRSHSKHKRLITH